MNKGLQKFDDHFFDVESFFHQVQLAPFSVAMCGLTSFGRLLCLMLGNAQLLKFG